MNEKETAHKGLSKINIHYFISIRATLLQRYLSAYNKDCASNKVATLRSVQLESLIYLVVCVIGEQQSTATNSVDQPSLASFNVLHSVLVVR